MNSDDIAVLDSQVVANDSVDASRSIIEIVICEHDQDSVLALLSLDKNGISSEEL